MIKLTSPDTYTASIDGTEWAGITPQSRFWPAVQEMIARGAEVVDMTIPLPPEALLEQWREGASITQAQARLALRQLDLLETVQAMADSDPDAAIVWEWAGAINRNSPFIEALKGVEFSDTQIDDIFKYAQSINA